MGLYEVPLPVSLLGFGIIIIINFYSASIQLPAQERFYE